MHDLVEKRRAEQNIENQCDWGKKYLLIFCGDHIGDRYIGGTMTKIEVMTKEVIDNTDQFTAQQTILMSPVVTGFCKPYQEERKVSIWKSWKKQREMSISGK